MNHNACPACVGFKLVERLVCYDCWIKVPFELQHAYKHSVAFSPAHQQEAAAKIIAHLKDRRDPGPKPAVPDTQLALL